MPLRPFFSYYGGKARHAGNHYPAPRHGTIIEPFAGSAGYALHYPEWKVILCDLDPVIVGIWSYLLRVQASEILAIPDVPLDGTVADIPGICEEARWLIGFWCARGRQHPSKKPSSWMRQGQWPASFWGERVRQTIASQLDAIRHWEIRHGSYHDLDAAGGATWFVDPPYQRAGYKYRCGSRGIDYAHLAQWCRSRPGQVIVCEASGADWLPFQDVATIQTTRKDKPATEAVWLSGEQYRQLTIFDALSCG